MIIDVIYFNEGAGHYTSALAAKDILERNGHTVTVLNVTDFTNSESLKDYYALKDEEKDNALRLFYKTRNVDIVLSTVSLLNRALCTSIKRANDKIIYITLVCELSECTPDYWVPPGLDQHLIVGNNRMVDIAKINKYQKDRIHKTTGLVAHSAFYNNTNREQIRRELGFTSDEKVGLVMFGGGVASFSPQLDVWAKVMSDLKILLMNKPVIFLCGKNSKALSLLSLLPVASKHRIFANLNGIHDYMNASDYCIGKPGCGFITSAIVTENVIYSAKPNIANPQEFFVLDYIKDKKLGVTSENFRSMETDLNHLFENFEVFKSNVKKERVNAVFELPGIIENIKSSNSQ